MQHKIRITSKKKLTKQKQVNIKQQKQQFFRAQKVHKRGKLLVLRFFYDAKFFLKKNRWKIVLIISFIILLMCTTLNSPTENLFASTYFYLFYSWSPVRIFFLPMIIFENFFLPVRISSFPYASIFFFLCVRIFFINNYQ